MAVAVEKLEGNICESSEEWSRVVERIQLLISLAEKGPPTAPIFIP